jgi:hypothetical protein
MCLDEAPGFSSGRALGDKKVEKREIGQFFAWLGQFYSWSE